MKRKPKQLKTQEKYQELRNNTTDFKKIKKRSRDESDNTEIKTNLHNLRSSDKKQCVKEDNKPGPSNSDSGKTSKRKGTDDGDQLISNFWQKSREKYQKISKKQKTVCDIDLSTVAHGNRKTGKATNKVPGSKGQSSDILKGKKNRRLKKRKPKVNSEQKHSTLELESYGQRKIKSTDEANFFRDEEQSVKKSTKSKELPEKTTSIEGVKPEEAQIESDSDACYDDESLHTEDKNQTDICDMKGCNLYQVPYGVLMTMEKDAEICFHGYCRLIPLCGTISVFGSELRRGKHYDFFSPDSHSYLTIYCCNIETSCSFVKQIYKDHLLDPNHIHNSLPANMTAIFKMEYLESRFCNIIPRYFPFQQIFQKQKDVTLMPYWEKELLKVGLTYIENAPKVNFPNGYYEITEKAYGLIESSKKRGSSPVLTIVGGKNSGKSTTNRFLINSLLNKVDTVYFLECDVGQTEFTPPGCVSLHCITKPVLGPPFTHQRPAIHSCFFGGVTPADDPTRYLTCIEQCFSKYLEADKKGPLIVNTMGWNKDVGLALTVDTIRLVQPLLLVQINVKKLIVNFPPMTAEFVRSHSGWRGKKWNHKWRHMHSLPRYDLYTLDAAVDIYNSHITRYKPGDHRDLTLYNYFTSDLEIGKSLTSVTPYTIPWKSIAIHVCHTAVENSQILYAINGCLVALVHADLSEAERNDEESPWLFKTAPVCQCIGFGYVRGIDPVKQELYIVTPVSPERLKCVNTLLRGNVNLPNQILLKQKCSGPLPYVTRSIATTGSGVLRQRHQRPKRPNK